MKKAFKTFSLIGMTAHAQLLSSANGTAATGTPTNIYNDFLTNTVYINTLFIIGGVLILVGLIFFFIGFGISTPRKIIGGIFLLAGICAMVVAAYSSSGDSKVATTFSPTAMLAFVWTNYKQNFVESSTSRTIDPSQQSVTTSEGQSYTMLRSVWLDDQTTFDVTWNWTKANLSRPKDNLFAWRYGEQTDGSYGILTADGGENTASDADSDIALSLVFAYNRWQDPQYLAAAKGIISDIWNKEVVMINGTPYLAADDLEKTSKSPTIAVNVSYFSPYAYRILGMIDQKHPWSALIDSSYSIMQTSMAAPLDKNSFANLPPDWIGIDKKTGAITPLVSTSGSDSNYGYDAMRLPWRLALDWKWNEDPRDKQILDQMQFLQTQWRNTGKLMAIYGHDGSPQANYEDPATYGGDIGYFIVSDLQDAPKVYENKLLILYDPDVEAWKVPIGYYGSNWAWFGMALYNDQLPDLAKNMTSTPA